MTTIKELLKYCKDETLSIQKSILIGLSGGLIFGLTGLIGLSGGLIFGLTGLCVGLLGGLIGALIFGLIFFWID